MSLKELKSLVPFSWDPRASKHPPGKKALRDFERIETSWRSGAAIEDGSLADTPGPSATPRERRRSVGQHAGDQPWETPGGSSRKAASADRARSLLKRKASELQTPDVRLRPPATQPRSGGPPGTDPDRQARPSQPKSAPKSAQPRPPRPSTDGDVGAAPGTAAKPTPGPGSGTGERGLAMRPPKWTPARGAFPLPSPEAHATRPAAAAPGGTPLAGTDMDAAAGDAEDSADRLLKKRMSGSGSGVARSNGAVGASAQAAGTEAPGPAASPLPPTDTGATAQDASALGQRTPVPPAAADAAGPTAGAQAGTAAGLEAPARPTLVKLTPTTGRPFVLQGTVVEGNSSGASPSPSSGQQAGPAAPVIARPGPRHADEDGEDYDPSTARPSPLQARPSPSGATVGRQPPPPAPKLPLDKDSATAAQAGPRMMPPAARSPLANRQLESGRGAGSNSGNQGKAAGGAVPPGRILPPFPGQQTADRARQSQQAVGAGTFGVAVSASCVGVQSAAPATSQHQPALQPQAHSQQPGKEPVRAPAPPKPSTTSAQARIPAVPGRAAGHPGPQGKAPAAPAGLRRRSEDDGGAEAGTSATGAPADPRPPKRRALEAAAAAAARRAAAPAPATAAAGATAPPVAAAARPFAPEQPAPSSATTSAVAGPGAQTTQAPSQAPAGSSAAGGATLTQQQLLVLSQLLSHFRANGCRHPAAMTPAELVAAISKFCQEYLIPAVPSNIQTLASWLGTLLALERERPQVAAAAAEARPPPPMPPSQQQQRVQDPAPVPQRSQPEARPQPAEVAPKQPATSVEVPPPLPAPAATASRSQAAAMVPSYDALPAAGITTTAAGFAAVGPELDVAAPAPAAAPLPILPLEAGPMVAPTPLEAFESDWQSSLSPAVIALYTQLAQSQQTLRAALLTIAASSAASPPPAAGPAYAVVSPAAAARVLSEPPAPQPQPASKPAAQVPAKSRVQPQVMPPGPVSAAASAPSAAPQLPQRRAPAPTTAPPQAPPQALAQGTAALRPTTAAAPPKQQAKPKQQQQAPQMAPQPIATGAAASRQPQASTAWPAPAPKPATVAQAQAQQQQAQAQAKPQAKQVRPASAAATAAMPAPGASSRVAQAVGAPAAAAAVAAAMGSTATARAAPAPGPVANPAAAKAATAPGAAPAAPGPAPRTSMSGAVATPAPAVKTAAGQPGPHQRPGPSPAAATAVALSPYAPSPYGVPPVVEDLLQPSPAPATHPHAHPHAHHLHGHPHPHMPGPYGYGYPAPPHGANRGWGMPYGSVPYPPTGYSVVPPPGYGGYGYGGVNPRVMGAHHAHHEPFAYGHAAASYYGHQPPPPPPHGAHMQPAPGRPQPGQGQGAGGAAPGKLKVKLGVQAPGATRPATAVPGKPQQTPQAQQAAPSAR